MRSICARDVRRHINIKFVLQRKPQPITGVLLIINNQEGAQFHRVSSSRSFERMKAPIFTDIEGAVVRRLS